MDANLSRDKVAGFLGQSFVRIPRKVFTMLFHGKGPGKDDRHGVFDFDFGSLFC